MRKKLYVAIIAVVLGLTLVHSRPEASSTVEQADCALCGDKSIFNYYAQFDNIGLLYLNTFEMDEVRIFDSDGKLGYLMMGGRRFNKDVSCHMTVVPDRRYATLDIQVSGEAQYADLKKLSTKLCQDCLEKAQSVDKFSEEGERPLALVIIDLKTRELYPLSERHRSYSVRDYVLFIRHEKDKKEVIVFYSPLEEGAVD